MFSSAGSRQRVTARKHRPDYSIVLLAGLLLMIGLVVIFSLGPALQISAGITASKQFVSIAMGVLAFCITAFVPLRFWHRAQGVLVGLALLASVALLFSPAVNGAQRWLFFGSLSFQPSELLKFVTIIYVASFLASRAKRKQLQDSRETLLPIAAVLAVLSIFIVLFQKDLGTAMVVTSMVLGMLYVSGVSIKHLGGFVAGLGTAAILAVLTAPHRLERLTTFLSSSTDTAGTGYHINQALIAVGSGGLFGVGLGRSVQAYGYLPEAGNDSIFAIYAENFGFIGTVVTLAIFGVLLFKIISVIERAPNMYMKLIATGVFVWLLSHIVVNVGAMLGIMPLTGITLPLLSYGGSSLLFTMAALGLVFNISRYTKARRPRAVSREESAHGNSTSYRRRDRRTRYAS